MAETRPESLSWLEIAHNLLESLLAQHVNNPFDLAYFLCLRIQIQKGGRSIGRQRDKLIEFQEVLR